MKVGKVNLKQVATNDENPRSITDTKFAKLVNNVLSFPKMLELRPIVISDEMKALGGNMRLRALQHISKMKPSELDDLLAAIPDYTKATDGERDAVLNHWKEWLKKPTAPVVYASTLTEQEQRRFVILDNVGFGDWDWDELANKWDGEELGDLGLDNWGAGDGWPSGDTAGTEGEEGNYSRKITTPVYEPTGEDVPLLECYDTQKADALIAKINASQVDEQTKDFLRLAAYRHVRFNYERIADYYANAPKEVQELIEDSALVIIDFNKAIEDGFIKISQDLLDQYGRENCDGGE
jgi:hypothetical protein|nr:MAG TPA: ParB protein [Caudoviricetes sp.]